MIWFAILQMLSPLIHAHVEADQPEQGHGVHVHVQDFFQTQNEIPHLYSIANNIHTIGVDKALVKILDLLPLPLFVILFTIAMLSVFLQASRCQSSSFPHLPLYLRPQLSPRAPPLF